MFVKSKIYAGILEVYVELEPMVPRFSVTQSPNDKTNSVRTERMEVVPMNENTMVVNNRTYMNKTLQTITDKVRTYDMKIRENQYAIAYLIGRVDRESLYTDDGLESCVEWAMESFGIGKSLAYELIGIGKDFTMEVRNAKGKVIGYCSNLVDHKPDELPPVDYTCNQLGRLYKMGREKVKGFHDEGKISPRMTFRELLDFIKSTKPPKQIESKPEPEPEPVPTEPTEPTEPEPVPTEPTEPTDPNIETHLKDNAIPRQIGFDLIPTEYLICELRARGFEVKRGNTIYIFDWKETEPEPEPEPTTDETTGE